MDSDSGRVFFISALDQDGLFGAAVEACVAETAGDLRTPYRAAVGQGDSAGQAHLFAQAAGGAVRVDGEGDRLTAGGFFHRGHEEGVEMFAGQAEDVPAVPVPAPGADGLDDEVQFLLHGGLKLGELLRGDAVDPTFHHFFETGEGLWYETSGGVCGHVHDEKCIEGLTIFPQNTIETDVGDVVGADPGRCRKYI